MNNEDQGKAEAREDRLEALVEGMMTKGYIAKQFVDGLILKRNVEEDPALRNLKELSGVGVDQMTLRSLFLASVLVGITTGSADEMRSAIEKSIRDRSGGTADLSSVSDNKDSSDLLKLGVLFGNVARRKFRTGK